MSYPINWSSGYLTPALYIDNTDYITAHPLPGQKHGLARTLPIFDIHTGAYFDRPLNFGKHHFIQTLEPELLYLFVPYTNQDDAPTYDTYLLPFSFNQLFTVNRFTGFDRLQNANQVSLGLTSRVISSIDGSDKLRLNLGTIYYMTRPKVCLTPGCTPTTNHLSPVVGEATFYPAPHWSASTNWAWDPNVSNTNNANFNLSYSRDSSHLISAGYNFVNTENSPQYSNFNAGFFWPLTHHWSAMGYTYYNLTEHHPDSYYYGLQYNSCCWSLRFVSERDYLGANIGASGNQYKTAYYVQLALNGLGAIGNKNTDDLLLNTLPGYNPQLR
jgi:LPS-assembly protein